MDTYKLLDNKIISPLWCLNQESHARISSSLAFMELIYDLLFRRKLSVKQMMKRLPEISQITGRECANNRFSYLNHYYEIYSLINYGWLLNLSVDDIKKRTSTIDVF